MITTTVTHPRTGEQYVFDARGTREAGRFIARLVAIEWLPRGLSREQITFGVWL